MTAGRSSEAYAVMAIALAVHRAPAAHAELLRGNAPLPSGVAVLLRIAGGTEPQELDASLTSLAPVGELRKAALFFIEQVLFQREATHYRVLGLNPDARPEQIKEHHRLLMRLFHPDRGSLLDEREEQFATRANLAYNTLRDADARAAYDSGLKPSRTVTRQAPRRAPPPVVRRRMVQQESFWTVRVSPVFMRYLPQWVLAGTALVSLSVVGAVYLFNPPVHLHQAAASAETLLVAEKPLVSGVPAVDAAAAAAAETSPTASGEGNALDEVAAQFERKVASAGQALLQTETPLPTAPETMQLAVPEKLAPIVPPPSPSMPVARSLPVQEARVQPQPQPQAKPQSRIMAQAKPVQKAAAVEPVRPVVAVSKAPAPAAVRAETAPVATSAPGLPERPVVAATVMAPPVMAAAPAEVAPPPPLPDPNSLLKLFLEAYERGDMQACMALLDDGLRADAGGKSDTRREYDALFRGTDLRHIKILNMNWSRDGEFIRGEGRYRATQMRKGETILRTQDGQVRIEMVRRGDSARINGLYYLPGGRS